MLLAQICIVCIIMDVQANPLNLTQEWIPDKREIFPLKSELLIGLIKVREEAFSSKLFRWNSAHLLCSPTLWGEPISVLVSWRICILRGVEYCYFSSIITTWPCATTLYNVIARIRGCVKLTKILYKHDWSDYLRNLFPKIISNRCVSAYAKVNGWIF